MYIALTVYCVIVCGSFLDVSHGFIPNIRRTIFTQSSITHKEMTEAAVREMAILFMNDNTDLYPDQEAALSTSDFKEAIEHFRDAVAKPDLESQLSDLPEAHFDAEQIVAANRRLLTERVRVLTAITADDMTAARDITGQLLHTLQDFYSHTNWVEMGKTGINAALGDPAQAANIGRVATLNEPTCTNCQDPDFETCRNNIRGNINSANILTSGYVLIQAIDMNPFSDPDPALHKPVGREKCSHGGGFDLTVNIPGTGGINKDSNNPSYSPHSHLHPQAARLAQEATLEFLKGIRAIRNEEEFGKFLGLEHGASLCFVVDTTGSMANEIAAVRQTTIRITENSITGPNKPTDFILSPFNDPGFGPLTKTESSDTMISALGRLSAIGGGDAPELYFSGLMLALRAVRPGSTCYTFTDAPAKDYMMQSDAIALAVAKKVKVYVIYTSSSKRRRRSTHRVKRDAPAYYTELAMASGGQVIDTPDSEIDETVKVVDVDISAALVTIVHEDNLVGAGEYSVPVDETMTRLIISVTGSVGNVEIINPSGVTEVPGAVNSSATVERVIDTSSVQLYSIATPIMGIWKVKIASGSYSLRVTAKSLVDFTYKFVENVDSGHGGYRTIDGRPLAGENVTMVVEVYGATNPVTGGAVTKGLAEVTGMLFVEEDGDQLKYLDLYEIKALKEYETSSVLPSIGFRVVLEGKDKQGNKIQRWHEAVVTTAKNTVRVAVDGIGNYNVIEGESINVNVSVTNAGDQDATYDLTISDSQEYFQSLSASALTVAKNRTATVVATFTAPDEVPLGQISSVIVVAADQAGSDENFIVFRLSVTSKNPDTTPPVCTIKTTLGNCNATQRGELKCADDPWFVAFSAQDSGFGLNAIRTQDVNDQATFVVGNFTTGETGVVHGRYSSDCCKPNVSVVASDILGNVGKCEVAYDTTETSGCGGYTYTTCNVLLMATAIMYFLVA